ncbi:hypothetical protein BHF71_08815 [Vulcanibacillus modesticaldus]|uniref:DUF192 domain-containing protein n=1 Tax=Vulcanibacillus modesticaldus TaxID=337097 RepID=A0A1D2YUX7_9BACI|nr:DUF192 domain-containing protein [Vulcanibacillus modesticaldus]OEF99510.1 hypothetical protein BHF71_08815 [Vulcanibacillus modesticaldus]
MGYLILSKADSESLLVKRLEVADSFFKRFLGLMFKKSLAEDEGMLLTKTRQIHTFWMRFPIDVLYLRKIAKNKYEIVGLEENLSPWRISMLNFHSTDVLELKTGSIAKKHIEIGEEIKYCSEKKY